MAANFSFDKGIMKKLLLILLLLTSTAHAKDLKINLVIVEGSNILQQISFYQNTVEKLEDKGVTVKLKSIRLVKDKFNGAIDKWSKWGYRHGLNKKKSSAMFLLVPVDNGLTSRQGISCNFVHTKPDYKSYSFLKFTGALSGDAAQEFADFIGDR